MIDPPPPQPGPGPIWTLAVTGLTAAAAGLSLHLAWAQLLLTHGTAAGGPCLPGAACAAALTAPAATLSGVPATVWALPAQLLVLLLLGSARKGDLRGLRARGGLVVLTASLALASVVVFGGTLGAGGAGCLGCLALVATHLLLAASVLAPAGGRRPAMPMVDDWLVAMLVGLTAVMGFGFGARIIAFQLDQAAHEALAEPALELPADAAVATALVDVGLVAVPEPRSPAPIDDQDPYLGPLDAAVTVVAFLDLQDDASRQLAWSLVELEGRYDDRVRFITKHLPMDASCNSKRRRTTHPRACAVAVALQCAHLQGGFRGYRQQLLRNWHAVDDAQLDGHADALGLDLPTFVACRAGDEGIDAVEADIKQAGKGTLIDPPWVFVEGRVLEGVADPAAIEATIAVALGERALQEDGRATAMMPVSVQGPLPLGAADMVAAGGAWIDPVEASVTVDGQAVAVVGVQPHVADLFTARAACEASGRRLCTRAEWVSACQGRAPVDDDGDGDAFDDVRQGRLQPYGDPWRSGWCASATTAKAGSHPACRTPEGVHDLAGNLAEWVDEGLLLGGAAGDGRAIGCHQASQPPGPGWRSPTTGFRCCSDQAVPPVAAPPGPPPVLPSASLPAALRAAAGEGPVLVVPWRTDCALCQQALVVARQATDEGGQRLLALAVQDDPASARDWLQRGGLRAIAVDDADAVIAGTIGVPALPWIGAYDADGTLTGAWTELPEAQVLSGALPAP